MPIDDPTDPGATTEQLIAKYGVVEMVGRRSADRDNRGAELARALFTPTPRPTTQLDLLAGGYLLGALSVLTGGLFGIAGTATIGGSATTGAALGAIDVTGAVAAGTRTMLVDAITGRVYVAGPTWALHIQLWEAAGIGRFVGVVGAIGRFTAGRLTSFEHFRRHSSRACGS
jgi:hypothetical protein